MFRPPPFDPSRPGILAPARVDPAGLRGPTPKQARGSRWRRTSPGLYLPAEADLGVLDQRVVAAAGVLGPGEAVTGWASLAWRGARWFDGTVDGHRPAPVPLVVRRHLVAHHSYRLSQEFLSPVHLELVDGLAVTSVRWATAFEARWAVDLAAAVVVIDMAAYSDLVSIAELAPFVGSRMAPTGIGQARTALALADENSWSPRETLMRLLWRWWRPEALLLCNHPVFDRAGRHLATPDLIDPVAGIVGEYEGTFHLAPGRRSTDVRREGRLREVGLEVVTMVGGDTDDDHRSFLHRLAAAHERAALTRKGPTAWTLERPAWWVDTSTVAARRALDPWQRHRLLAHRRVS